MDIKQTEQHQIKYNRVLLKLSGETLSGSEKFGINENVLMTVSNEIAEIVALGVEVGIVIGGGNIFRGGRDGYLKLDKISGDYMGMLATVINGIALKEMLAKVAVKSELFSSIDMPKICKSFRRESALDSLNDGKVTIFVAGTGNPRVTTDTAAALKAIEINANILLKATRVDGVYSKDPEKESSAILYKNISYDDVCKNQLKIMDLSAISLCMENEIPIVVFNFTKRGNLKKIISGEEIGTLVSNA